MYRHPGLLQPVAGVPVQCPERRAELLPEAPQLNYVLGRNFSGAGYYEDAIKALEAALSVEPNFVEAQMELGLTYRRRGDAQEGPDAEALRKTHYDQAIDHLERAIKLRSNYEDALAALGAVYRRRGDKERDLNHDAEAREYYERAREYYEQAYNADPLTDRTPYKIDFEFST